MSTFDLDEIGGRAELATLIDVVSQAGEQALALYRGGVAARAEAKSDRSPVTEADRAVEHTLLGYLRARYPDAAFVGEETGRSGPAGARFTWVVDPIDGTRAFIRGMSTWSILVGLLAGEQAVLGIAAMPAQDDLFVAVRGEGAFGNGRPLRVSDVDTLERCALSHGALAQFTDAGLGKLLCRLGESTFTQRGFADFESYRQLVLGQVDAVVDPGVKPWDICAAKVIVEEAGGRLTSFEGKDTLDAGSALATNGKLHPAMLALVQAS